VIPSKGQLRRQQRSLGEVDTLFGNMVPGWDEGCGAETRKVI
jgi:hypothetical protein